MQRGGLDIRLGDAIAKEGHHVFNSCKVKPYDPQNSCPKHFQDFCVYFMEQLYIRIRVITAVKTINSDVYKKDIHRNKG